MRLVALVAVGGTVLAAAACGEKPAENTGTGGTPTGEKYVACMVTDQGGLDDRSFNASAWKGLENAKAQNPNIEIKNVQSKTEADYEPNLKAFVDQKCNLILAVGGLMFTQTMKVAQANPSAQFAIVDAKIDLPNVHSMQFDTAQAAFLAGYLAAGMTKSGKVATYGGLNIPPVAIFMDGFADGVKHYNTVKSKAIQVLGWDKATQKGTFAESFIDTDKGKALSDTFVAQGADIIVPVAGKTGVGTATAAKASNGQYSVIWVDVDGCESNSVNCSAFLTTIVKNMPDAVRDGALALAKKEKPAPFLGTLANNGVSIAGFHDFESKVPAELKTEVEALKQDIISGKIKVESTHSPK